MIMASPKESKSNKAKEYKEYLTKTKYQQRLIFPEVSSRYLFLAAIA
jgi:hypothetical protein